MRVVFVCLLAVTISNLAEAKDGSDSQSIKCNVKMGGSAERIAGTHEVADFYHYFLDRLNASKGSVHSTKINAQVEVLKAVPGWQEGDAGPKYIWVMEEPNSFNKVMPVVETRTGSLETRIGAEETNPADESVFGFDTDDGIRFRSVSSGHSTKARSEYFIDFSNASFDSLIQFYEVEKTRAINLARDLAITSSGHISEAGDAVASALLVAEGLQRVVASRALYIKGEDAGAMYNAFQIGSSASSGIAETYIVTTKNGGTKSITTFGKILLIGSTTSTGVDYTVDMTKVTDPKNIQTFASVIDKQKSSTDLKITKIIRMLLGYTLPIIQSKTRSPSTIVSVIAKNDEDRAQHRKKITKPAKQFQNPLDLKINVPQATSAFVGPLLSSRPNHVSQTKNELQLQATKMNAKNQISQVTASQRIKNKLKGDRRKAELEAQRKEQAAKSILGPIWTSRFSSTANVQSVGILTRDGLAPREGSGVNRTPVKVVKSEFPMGNAANDSNTDGKATKQNSLSSSDNK